MGHLNKLTILISLISCQNHKSLDNDKLYRLTDTINYTDFQVIFDGNSKGNYYSSIDSSFSRKYRDEDKSIKLILTNEEKRKIYETIKKADIFSIPDTLIEGGGSCTLPCFSTRIIITIGQKKKIIYYSGFSEIKDKDIERRFKIIKMTISDIIFNKDEVKKMPKSNMRYM